MKMTPELTRLAENVATLRREFDAVNDLLKEKQETVKNLLDTRKKLEEETSRQSEGWEQSLLASGGIESEDSDRATLLASLAKDKLGRISPLIDAARAEVLTLRYNAAEKARHYDFAWRELCAALIQPECEALLTHLRDSLAIAHGLFALSPLPPHEFDNLLGTLVRDITRENDLTPAREYLAAAAEDSENALHLWPGSFPENMRNVMRRSPSGGQMALARNDPEKMRALADGREPCKGMG